jgi:Tfp pilus assembly PilM family ATPase
MISNKSIGLDIGLNKIKAISLTRQNKGFAFDGFSVVPLPPKGMFSEAPLDEQEMALAVKKAVDSLKQIAKT